MGKRINNPALTITTFEEAVANNALMLVDWTGLSQARVLSIKNSGNTWIQGSEDGASYHNSITSSDEYLRFSSDGGTTWLVFPIQQCLENIINNHIALTLGTANGLSIDSANQVLSLAIATTTSSGALSASDKVKIDIITNTGDGLSVLSNDGTYVLSSTLGEFATMSNEGTGVGIYKTKSSGNFQLKTLKSSDGSVVFTPSTDEIDIVATGTGGGEANTISNVGTVGTGIFKQKNGIDLELYKINSPNSDLTIALNGTDRIDFTINQSAINHDSLSGFISSEHVDHSLVSITGVRGLNGGGDISGTVSPREIYLDITSLATHPSPGLTDTIAVYDPDTTTHYELELNNLPLKWGNLSGTIANQTDLTSYFVPQTRSILTSSGLSGGGVLSADRTISLSINDLTSIAYDSSDYVLVYDPTGAAHRKLLLSNFPTSGFTLNTLTADTQTFANDTNVTITSATSTHTIGWSGQLSATRGGTGIGSYTTGDILISTASNTLSKLGIGSSGQVLGVSSGVPAWINTNWLQSGSDIYYSAGKVGVGVLPIYSFEVLSTLTGAARIRNSTSGGYGLIVSSGADSASNDIVTMQANGTSKFLFKADGTSHLLSYGSGTITGTATYLLGVTSAGKIIETTSTASSKWQQLTSAIAPNTITDEVRIGTISDLGSEKLQIYGGAVLADTEPIIRFQDTDNGSSDGKQYRVRQSGLNFYIDYLNSSDSWITSMRIARSYGFEFFHPITSDFYLDQAEVSTPSTPLSGYSRLWIATDGKAYLKTDSGVTYDLTKQGTVTSVDISSTDFTISGNPITSSGTIVTNLNTQAGVTAGSYSNSNVTVNSKGIITAISNGVSGGGVNTYLALTDTPGTFTANYFVKNNSTGTALEHVAQNTINISGFNNNSGFITTSSVTYETLNSNGDVGTGSGQLAIGNHTHSYDNYAKWILNVNGSLAEWISSGYILNLAQGTNTTLSFDDLTNTLTINSVGSVTSVAAGNGMTFSTINSSGNVTLGTPSNITSSTTNLVSTGTHTHALGTSGVTAGSYTNASITVDSKGIITAASSGSGGGGNVYNSGTPTAGQYARWTNATTIEGVSISTLKTDLNLVKSDVGLGNVENTAISTWTGSTNLISVGNIITPLTEITSLESSDLLSISDVSDTPDSLKKITLSTLATFYSTTFLAYDAGLSNLAGVTMGADKFYYTTADNVHAAGTVTSFARTLLDDTDSSSARTTLGVVIGTNVQAYSSDLTTLSGLSKTDSNFIVGNGTSWVVESGSTARTSLGLGTIATQNSASVSITGGSISGITDLGIADGGTGSSTASGARTNLGLGTISTQDSSSVSITGGSIAGITDLAIADGGTGASTALDARNNLGLGSLATQSTVDNDDWGTRELTVPHGGTGVVSLTPYAVLCGGTTSTGALQSMSSVGTSGQVLTSNGASALPTFQTVVNLFQSINSGAAIAPTDTTDRFVLGTSTDLGTYTLQVTGSSRFGGTVELTNNLVFSSGAYIQLYQNTVSGTPSSNSGILYMDSADDLFCYKNSTHTFDLTGTRIRTTSGGYSSYTIGWYEGRVIYCTLDQNITLNIQNIPDGGWGYIYVTQDSTGSRTFSPVFITGSVTTILTQKYLGSYNSILSTANKTTLIKYRRIGSTNVYVEFIREL